MKILFFTHLTEEFPALIDELKEKWKEHSFICARSKDEYLEHALDSHILVYGNPSDDIIKRAAELKLIIVPYAGVGQLNFPLIRSRMISVANSHGNGAVVAERALGLAMACCGRIVEFHNDMKEGNWHRTGDQSRPFDYWYSIAGKKISILGTGSIGKSLSRLLKGFDCSVLGFRKNSGELTDYFDAITTDLDEALRFGDLVFLALPSTKETENIISRDKISLLEGKFVINVGRGSLIEEEPFFDALKSGTVKGAGIDAWYEYPSKENPAVTGSAFPFHELPNVVISPHAASHAPEGKLGQLTGACQVLETYLHNGTVINSITGDY
ncbi:2-hydroxyacid dehydrogenase [Spirochaeta isovalerica]|uniref:Phosphoglycerate dehydrogenase-like enzyme n=1 Tax=Spirochaeta isovalerica TaxID=150 RepID=A0A841RDN8_9SPIO|nr:2-hydroxyacid dehydrogenase [Spirochaeta isovalerica]MBB6482093.1 phosphoglycerate dehydrogenase-like enzyme [Spirochaeta isovalerica]